MNGFLTLLLKTGISGLFFWCIFLSEFVSEFLLNHIGFRAIHFSSMFDFIRRIFCCGRKNQPPICSPFLALKKLLFPLSYRVAWDDGCPVTTQANVRSWSRKKTELTCPKSLTNTLRKAPRRTKKCSGQSVACEENQGEKKKLTLEELKKLSPPGYKEFEAAVGSKDLDEETALQLWEDIFKSLDIFEISKIAYINPTVITQPT